MLFITQKNKCEISKGPGRELFFKLPIQLLLVMDQELLLLILLTSQQTEQLTQEQVLLQEQLQLVVQLKQGL